MEFNTQMQDGNCITTLSGKFTFSDHTEFRNIIDSLSSTDIKQMVLDMSQVTFVDSAALGMLLLARDEATKNSKPLSVQGVTGQVKKIFELARFDTMFKMK